MVFRRKLLLRLDITYARGVDPDVDESIYNALRVNTDRPREAYHALCDFGLSADLTWPAGADYYEMSDGFLSGPNLVTDFYGEESGVRSWSFSAEPCRIPGKFQVALYEDGNADLTSPDVFAEYDLTDGAWSTGNLPIHSGTTALYTRPFIRFVPYHLISLLP